MKLYAVALAAWRTSHQDIELANGIAIVLAESASQARLKGKQAAIEMFPPSIEWYDHRSEVIEIEQYMTLDTYRLTWHIEKIE